MKVTGCIGEFYLHANCYFLSPVAVHSSSSVSSKAIIRNINRTGAMLLHFLTPTFKLVAFSILPIMS